MVKQCAECGKEFVAKTKKARYCSGACTSRAYRRRFKANYNVTCAVCGEEFTTTRSTQKYCSESCKRKAENMRVKKKQDNKPFKIDKKWLRGPSFDSLLRQGGDRMGPCSVAN